MGGGAAAAWTALVVENGAARMGWMRGARGMAAGLTRHRSEWADAMMLEGLGVYGMAGGQEFYRGIGANWAGSGTLFSRGSSRAVRSQWENLED